jgi:hypothetical protein
MPACPVGPRENAGTGPADRTGVVIFFTCLDLEQKTSFMDGQKLDWCNACLLIVISICFFMIYFFHGFYLIMLHFVDKSRVFYC